MGKTRRDGYNRKQSERENIFEGVTKFLLEKKSAATILTLVAELFCGKQFAFRKFRNKEFTLPTHVIRSYVLEP